MFGQIFDSIFGNTGEGGKNAGNVFEGGKNTAALLDQMKYAQTLAAQNTYGRATQEVQDNPLLSQLFGPQGQLQNSNAQLNDLTKRGYSLQPEDYEAYGQGSGNIARLFGQQEQSLAQSLADRGLSSSGVAGQQFSGLMGNKQEQLAQLQTQIAQKRMESNMQRIGQMQNFVSQLGGQAQNAIQGSLGAEDTRAKNLYNMGSDWLKNRQNTANENLQQYQQTNHGSGWGQLAGLGAQAGLAYATGGASGLSGAGGGGSLGGSSSSLFQPGRNVIS